MSDISLPLELKGVHIHFVGIKGTGMAALVEILYHNGAIITGSDVSERFYTDEILEKLNLKALPFDQANITDKVQYVIYSSAYKLDKNPDLIAAVKKGIPCLLYTQALGSYSSRAYSCGICGVHGKTSTTGLTGTILKELPLAAQTLAGSIINSFGSTCTYTSPLIKSLSENQKKYFVAETCEYQKHFMSFCPQKIILTSVESDHQDFYPTYESIRDAFVDYICKLPQNGELIYCADDKGAVEAAGLAAKKRPDLVMIPYGFKAEGDFKILDCVIKDECQIFNCNLIKDLKLKVPGHHEVLDAAAALALACRMLVSDGKNPQDYEEEIRRGLLSFTGGKRRSEKIADFVTPDGNNVLVMDDYGHHPTAIKTTLEGYRQFYSKRKIIVDFMSHTYSRTQSLLDEFASSFDNADVVILHKIYASARENIADFNITGRSLFEKAQHYHKNVNYFEEIEEALPFAKELLNTNPGPEYPDGYLFVTMGAGDNWKLGKAIIKEFGEAK
ncbi:UDP-N-acetylmuramate--L-alanine ligase [Treponema sp.]|uniref:UDP-N-acetylmuramate--L-alanine ligase n=1 Tax=Treponema sp. TaxID=166 RepID=UPI0025D7ABB3|nr:UDP-N-acetylmuramate--L-alanine ligase [Treponema sp.]MCR5217995.1 UDP-N-acetylmuramate--L-alanine ligase [Treponema sp.]